VGQGNKEGLKKNNSLRFALLYRAKKENTGINIDVDKAQRNAFSFVAFPQLHMQKLKFICQQKSYEQNFWNIIYTLSISMSKL
jgi:hypothetical protein